MADWKHNCVEAIRAASGREEMTDEEIEKIIEGVQIRIKRKMDAGMSAYDASHAVARADSAEAVHASLLEARTAAENIVKRQDLNNRVRPGAEESSVRSAIGGDPASAERGWGRGVDQEIKSRELELRGPLAADLDKIGALHVLKGRDRGMDRLIAREIARVSDPNVQPTGHKQAEAIGKVLAKHIEAGRVMLNEAGAYIAKLDGYIARQSHDMLKVRRAGEEQWIKDILPRLDERTFEDVGDPKSYLSKVYQNLASGVHDTASSNEVLGGFKGAANLAKRVSHDRDLIFKDSDHWLDYNDKYGKGGLVDAVQAQLHRAARDSGIMSIFGSNPGSMFDKWVGDLRRQAIDRGDLKQSDKLTTGPGRSLTRLFQTITGEGNQPHNLTGAMLAQTARNTMQLSRLGMVTLRSIPDIVITTAHLRYQGVGLLEGLAHQIGGLFTRSPADRAIATEMGIGLEGLTAGSLHRFSSEEGIPGQLSHAVDTFHKMNGLTPWTDSMKRSMGLMMSHNLARNAAKDFAKLDPFLQRSLGRYGIGADEWKGVQANVQRQGSRSYLLPGDVADDQLKRKLNAMFADTIASGMSESTASVRAMANMWGPPGSWGGELGRSILQFKSFGLSFIQRTINPALRLGGIDYPGVAYLAVGLTLAGAASNVLSDLVGNAMVPRAPRNAADYRQFVMDSFMAGGMAGLYGDVLLRDSNQSLQERLGGPLLSEAASITKMLWDVKKGSKNREEADIAGDRLGAILRGVTPGVTYPGAKIGFDYIYHHMLQEHVNPGYMDRLQKRARDDNKTMLVK